MVALNIFAVLLGLLAFTTDSFGQSAQLSPRMINGIPADTMKKFPHHVTIQPSYLGPYSGELPIYGGSIIHSNWVLTTLRCVEKGNILQIMFQKLYKNSTAGSYSAVVNNDETSVHKFPTEFDDMALIFFQFSLILSPTVRPISLFSSSSTQVQNKLVVLPGFESKESYGSSRKGQLTYAMMNLASNEVCQNSFQNNYDEFLHLCATPYNKNSIPCLNEFGAGLVYGYPANPQLMGMYISPSESNDCNPSSPFAFIKIEKYYQWIMDRIGEEPATTSRTTSTTWITTNAYD